MNCEYSSVKASVVYWRAKNTHSEGINLLGGFKTGFVPILELLSRSFFNLPSKNYEFGKTAKEMAILPLTMRTLVGEAAETSIA